MSPAVSSALVMLLALVVPGPFPAAKAPLGGVPGEGPGISSVTPPMGTRGTELILTGSGFGDKKPRVLLTPEADGKSRKLKVLEWSDVEIRARVRKVSAGVHGLVVRPKGKGAAELSLPAAFEAVPPADLTVDQVCVRASDEVLVSGTAFGPKQGKVFVDGRKAQVLSWAGAASGVGPDQVVFRVPPKNVLGSVGVEVRTIVGGTVLEDALLVLDSTDLGFSASFDGVVFEADVEGPATTVNVGGGQTHVLVADATGDTVEFRVLYDPALDGSATLDGLDILQFSWQRDGKLWVLDVDDQLQSSVALQLDPHCEGILLGSFSGFLVERFGEGTVQVSGGEFQVPLGR